MRRLSTLFWFRPITYVLLTTFFLLYGGNLPIYGSVSKAYAQSIDDLLEEDDSDLFGEPAEEAPAVEEPAEEPEPEVEPEPAKSKEPEPVMDENEDEEDEEELEEEEEPVAPKPQPKEELEEDEDEEYDEEMEEDEEPVQKAVQRVSSPQLADHRVDGSTKVLSIVIPSQKKFERRAAEQELLIENWLRGATQYTHMPVNDAYGEPSAVKEDSVAKKADRALEDGISAYNALKLGDAIDQLENALTAYGPILEFAEYRSKVEQARLYLGAANVLDGDEDEAIDVFTGLLMLNPKADISGKGFPTEVEEIFLEAKQGLSEASTASLSVNSSPDGLPVFLDGYFRGLTPIQLSNINAGEHFFEIKSAGYQDYSSRLTLYTGVSKKLNIKMKQILKYYSYTAELDTIKRGFDHRNMWESVRTIGDDTDLNNILLTSTSEANGVVTLEGFYYDIGEELYKTHTVRIELASEDIQQATYDYLATMMSDQVEWKDTYIPPEQVAKAEDDDEVTPFYKTWWFWTVIGVVVAGGAVVGAGAATDWFGTSGGGDNNNTDGDQGGPNAIIVNFRR